MTNSFSKKKIVLSARMADHEAATPLGYGVTLVYGPYEMISQYVRAVFIFEAMHGSDRLPIPLTQSTQIFSYIVGTNRQTKQLKSLYAHMGISGTEDKGISQRILQSHEQLDWFSPIAQRSLKSALAENTYVFCQQSPKVPISAYLLAQLNDFAKQQKSYVIVEVPGQAMNVDCYAIASEMLTVMPCDPNPGFDVAFCLECPELTQPTLPSSGRVHCSVRMGKTRLQTQFTPYIADDIETRFMAILKASGWTLEKIGSLFNLNKSNISRRLRSIETNLPENWDHEMLLPWVEACGVDTNFSKLEDKEEA